MTLFLCIVCFILGVAVGRIYGWMKYRYPEFQEKVKLEAARYRLQRVKIEAEEEEARARIDGVLDRQIEEKRRNVRRLQAQSKAKPW